MAKKLREIVRNPDFELASRNLEKDFKRADEFFRGIEWVLSREPREGNQLESGSPVWFIGTDYLDPHYRIIVFYTFNDERVVLLNAFKSSDD